MNNNSLYRYAEVNVEASRSLAETALIIGSILGIEFAEDFSGNYEEFPAYVGKDDEFSYALLGFPDKEHDLSDEPRVSYDLLVNSIETLDEAISMDFTQEIIARVLSAEKIKVW